METSTNLKIKLKSNNDIENVVQNLVTTIQSAIFHSSKPTKPDHRMPNKKTLPNNIKDLITLKRRARTRWQLNIYLSDKNAYNHLSIKND
jgi:hypothetical protein